MLTGWTRALRALMLAMALSCHLSESHAQAPAITPDYVKQLREKAKTDAAAANELGFLYAIGDAGVTKEPDMKSAFLHYKRAADLGLPEAKHKVAFCYENGLGVRASLADAAIWYRQAAEAEVAEAQYKLAMFYKQQKGGLRSDYNDEFVWFRKAAEGGLAAAQYELAAYYKSGRGTGRDDIEALKWYLAAAAHGEERAAKAADALIKFAPMPPPDVTKAQERLKAFEAKRARQ